MTNPNPDRSRYREGHLELVLDGTKEMSVTALVSYFIETGKCRSPQESFWVVPIDGAENVRGIIEIARGNYHEVDVCLPMVYTAVLAAGCDRFVAVHNHPTGDPSPTIPDLDLTRKVMNGANVVGLFFDDHIIVTPDGSHSSMARVGLIRPSERLERMAETNKRVDIATAKAVERGT